MLLKFSLAAVCLNPCVCFSESTLESKKSSVPRQTPNHGLPQAKVVPKGQPAPRGAGTNRSLTSVRPASKLTEFKVNSTLGSLTVLKFCICI